MPKVSINILTKNRIQYLKKALESIASQTFKDFDIVVVNDGSTDETEVFLKNLQLHNLIIVNHTACLGITQSRQEALENSKGEYIAILDDDDQWADKDKLKKQIEFLDAHQDVVLVGGGLTSDSQKFRPESNEEIRNTMLFRNNFFTSSVMFRRQRAIEAGGFKYDGVDLAEDYDLWLRIGSLGKMYNFQESFVNYSKPSYNKAKFKDFLSKQLKLIQREKLNYKGYWLASLILKLRLLF